jgi:uncharacterized protein YndB with AHSA1/START domain
MGLSRRTDRASLVVSAPPEEVFRAFTDAEALMSWLPPGTMTGRALEYDFRVAGRYRIELTYGQAAPAAAGKTTGRTDVSQGRFVTLEPGRRIVQTVEFDSQDPAFAGEMVITWELEPLGAQTRVTVSAANVPPGISKADHDAGLRATLDNLARYCTAPG